ncbi:hypothetical protein ACOSQ3_022208 [Xanthoceras sorbifolium]
MPNEIGSIPNLEILGLLGNNLYGHVPATIFNISTLKWLSLAGNKLSGSLPSSIGLGIPNIEVFLVGGNYLAGHFPTLSPMLPSFIFWSWDIIYSQVLFPAQ